MFSDKRQADTFDTESYRHGVCVGASEMLDLKEMAQFQLRMQRTATRVWYTGLPPAAGDFNRHGNFLLASQTGHRSCGERNQSNCGWAQWAGIEWQHCRR